MHEVLFTAGMNVHLSLGLVRQKVRSHGILDIVPRDGDSVAEVALSSVKLESVSLHRLGPSSLGSGAG